VEVIGKESEMAKFPHITIALELSGPGGDAFFIMGRVDSAMKETGVPESDRNAFAMEAMSGDYGHLIDVVREWVNVSDERDEA